MGTSISAIITVTTPALGVAPGPATALTASNIGISSLTLSWTAPTVGTPTLFYQPQVQVQGSGVWTNIGSGQITATTVSVTGLAANTTYIFQVITTNQTASSTSASSSPVTTLSIPPNAPTALAVVGTPGQTDINLQWTAPSVGTPPFTYQVSSRTPSGNGSFTPIGGSVTTTTEDITGLVAGTTYDFQVVATNGAGTGPASAILAGASTAGASVAPTVPLNITFAPITTTSVQVNWNAPAQGTPPLTYTVLYRPH